MIIFHNPGVIDITAVTTFGVNAKANESAVGYFGTGLKYAIAVLLREGGKIVIHAGQDQYDFGLEEAVFRGKTFQFVTMTLPGAGSRKMNTSRVGFTTELGKNWQPWMAYRELYCNARDENGSADSVPDESPLLISPDTTAIVVTGTAIEEAHAQRDLFIIPPGRTPRFKTDEIEVYDGMAEHLYYRGIRAGDVPYGKKSRFTYNYLKKTKLTEDRTIASTWEVATAARRAIVSQGDVGAVVLAVTAGEDSEFENHVSYQWHDDKPSENFMTAVAMVERERPAELSPSAAALVKQHRPRAAVAENVVEMTPQQIDILARALTWLARAGVTPTAEIKVVASLGKGVLGMMRNGVIYLPVTTIDEGARAVVKTLIEEHVHHQSGAEDSTRAMQEALLHQMLEMGEHLAGPVNDELLPADAEPAPEEDLPPAEDQNDDVPF